MFKSSLIKFQKVLLEKHLINNKYTGIQFLKLNDPKTLNSLSFEMSKEIVERVKELDQDKHLKCVILTGEGRGFSSGGDLNFLMERCKDTPENNNKIMMEFFNNFLSIRNIKVPIISCIQDLSMGAGLCLTLATDIRIASKDARMGFVFVQMGAHCGVGGDHFLPKVTNSQVAARLLLTGDVISGEEAKRLGLVVDAVDSDQLIPSALKIAETISTRSSYAVQSTLRTLRNKQNVGLEEALLNESLIQSNCFSNNDIIEGINAIKEKRLPNYNKLL